MTLTPKVNICTPKVCLRLMKPLHTNGRVITFPKHLLCNVLDSELNFLGSNDQKQSVVNAVPICLAHTFTAPAGASMARTRGKGTNNFLIFTYEIIRFFNFMKDF